MGCHIARLLPVGELLLERTAAYSPVVHLSWGDKAVNSHKNPTALRVHLKQSNWDQYGRGADVFVGRTNDLCLVVVILAYFTGRGGTPGPCAQMSSVAR